MKPFQGYTVLIDGYNVIKRIPQWRQVRLDASRKHLFALLRQTRWPFPVRRVVAVFDAAESADQAATASGGIHVRYASPSADAYIQETIRESPSPQSLLIVSNDAEILGTAKSHGVLRYSVEWLLTHSRPGCGTSDPEQDPDKLSSTAARRITEELTRWWIGPAP